MSIQIKDKIISIIRADFDQTPKNWGGDGWYDNAEEVADSIVALFASPQTDLVSRAEVLRVIRSLGAQDADLAMYGAADNARAREYGEAAATRACCAIALMPAASPSPAPAAVEELDFLRDLAARLRDVACPQIDGWDIDRLLEMAFREDAPRLCEVCGGDCSAANPPPPYCPTRDDPAPAAVEDLVARLMNTRTPGAEALCVTAATALSTLAADKPTAKLEAACKAKDEHISECSRLASRVAELDEALRVAKAELENHTEVPGVSEYVLPAIEAALSSSTNPEPREN